jgi:hypothetical protein
MDGSDQLDSLDLWPDSHDHSTHCTVHPAAFSIFGPRISPHTPADVQPSLTKHGGPTCRVELAWHVSAAAALPRSGRCGPQRTGASRRGHSGDVWSPPAPIRQVLPPSPPTRPRARRGHVPERAGLQCRRHWAICITRARCSCLAQDKHNEYCPSISIGVDVTSQRTISGPRGVSREMSEQGRQTTRLTVRQGTGVARGSRMAPWPRSGR